MILRAVKHRSLRDGFWLRREEAPLSFQQSGWRKREVIGPPSCVERAKQ